MNLMLNINIPKPDAQISHGQKILSVGSCFTEHIGNALKDLKFSVLQNPNGILFDPASVCASLTSYITNDQYSEADLFELNELWHSWKHHSRFSGMDKAAVIQRINSSQTQAHRFLQEADWLIITLGSSFSYRLTKETSKLSESSKASPVGGGLEGAVANCHRAPAQWFQKHLLSIDETVASLDNAIHKLFRFNPALRILFTISPVRHIRDGVMENNRSKARLLEAVHHLVNKFDKLYYFPSYELVIDVLRDYRFYSEDMVHPNYLATEFVLEHFTNTFITEESGAAIKEIKKLNIARKHKASHPQTEAHQRFLQSHYEKANVLQTQYPQLDFSEELEYFSQLGGTGVNVSDPL
ncbi:MAG: hypothetical protein JWP69_769 [Flaviaesturariibacter sp.]|nr:hypothetical protein [Flaviaesturariibacter sp.]